MALSFVFNDEFSEPEEDPLAPDVDIADIGIDTDVKCVVSDGGIPHSTVTDPEAETKASQPFPPLQQNPQPIFPISKPISSKKEIVKRKPKQYICPICSKSYLCKVGLSNHDKQRRSDAPLKCIISSCPTLVCTSFDLQSHYRECHHESLAKNRNRCCSHCSKSFAGPAALAKHSKVCRVRKKQSFQCEPCGRFYRYELGLRLHQQEYHHSDGRQTNHTIEAENTVKGCQDSLPNQNIDVIPSTDNTETDLAKCSTDSNSNKKHVPLAVVSDSSDGPVEVKTESMMEPRCQQVDSPNIPKNTAQVKVEVEDIKIKLDPSLFC